MPNDKETDAENRVGPFRGTRRWLGITLPEEIPEKDSPASVSNMRRAIDNQLRGLPRAIMVMTLSQSQIAEHRGLTDADPQVGAMTPGAILRVRHTVDQMEFASGDEVDCVYARVKGDHHLLEVLSWSQGTGAFEDENWKATMRRLQGPQDHLGRAAERAARRQGASVAHWQQNGGAGIWNHTQRELAAFESAAGIPKGSFARMLVFFDRLSLADFLDQQDWALQMVQNDGWPS